MELPCRPGDFLEWDNGAGHSVVTGINAIVICPDGRMRYDLGFACPDVNHSGVKKIVREEELKAVMRKYFGRKGVHDPDD